MISEKRQKGLEKIAEENANNNPMKNIQNNINKYLKEIVIEETLTNELKETIKTVEKPKEIIKRFVITTWDNDIYILTGYNSVQEIKEKMAGLEWLRMPNGSEIKSSSISKIQSFEDYMFQNDQKARHKKGQILYFKDDTTAKWWDTKEDYEVDTNIEVITGKIDNLKLNKGDK